MRVRGPSLLRRLSHQLTNRPWLDRLERYAARYGAVVRLDRATFLFNEPEVVDTILQGHRDLRVARSYEGGAELLQFWGQSLVVDHDEAWLRKRRRVQPAFDREHLTAYAPAMVEETRRMLDRWEDGKPRDVHVDFENLTLRIALKTVLGAAPDDCPDAIRRSLVATRELLENRHELGTDGPRMQEFRVALREVNAWLNAWIAKAESLPPCVLSVLLTKDEPLTADEIRDELVTSLRAAEKNTPAMLSWTAHLLASNPAAATKMCAEVDEVLGSREPTVEDVSKLQYVRAVAFEAMRLYPLYPTLVRRAARDCTVAGIKIPEGAHVVVSPWLLHRDARWFARPKVFMPERWEGGFLRRLPAGVYLPFGGGPRTCNASNYALQETSLILATIAQRFRFTSMDARVRPLLSPNGLRPEGGLRLKPVHRAR